MHSQQITIELPEIILQQLTLLAEATQQSVESLVSQSVLSNLPPATDMAPPELQPEFLRMQMLNVEELWAIAQAEVEPGQHHRHVELLRKNEADELSAQKQQELMGLREAADQLMLRKAYAWSLLMLSMFFVF
jgi:hypothetical protein